MRPLIAGNWKMNGVSASIEEVAAIVKAFSGAIPDGVDVLICPPATLVGALAAEWSDEGVAFGGQDCHANKSGAHTGDISAAMFADLGASHVIVGHSERRADHAESNDMVKAKAEAVLSVGLTPIICVGETEAERKANRQNDVVGEQLAGSLPETTDDIIVAYEPVWAIGTGLTPTLDDIKAVSYTHLTLPTICSV